MELLVFVCLLFTSVHAMNAPNHGKEVCAICVPLYTYFATFLWTGMMFSSLFILRKEVVEKIILSKYPMRLSVSFPAFPLSQPSHYHSLPTISSFPPSQPAHHHSLPTADWNNVTSKHLDNYYVRVQFILVMMLILLRVDCCIFGLSSLSWESAAWCKI